MASCFEDSPVPSHSQLMSIDYPQGGTGTNTVSMTYNADGSLATRTDQRGVVLTYTYDNAGHRLSQKVTSGSVDGDKKVEYKYTDLGHCWMNSEPGASCHT